MGGKGDAEQISPQQKPDEHASENHCCHRKERQKRHPGADDSRQGRKTPGADPLGALDERAPAFARADFHAAPPWVKEPGASGVDGACECEVFGEGEADLLEPANRIEELAPECKASEKHAASEIESVQQPANRKVIGDIDRLPDSEPAGLCSEIDGPGNGVGFPGDDRRRHPCDPVRLCDAISVRNEDDFALRRADANAQRLLPSGQAADRCLIDPYQAEVVQAGSARGLRRPVGAAVVDEYDFQVPCRHFDLLRDRLKAGSDRRGGVVRGNQHAQAGHRSTVLILASLSNSPRMTSAIARLAPGSPMRSRPAAAMRAQRAGSPSNSSTASAIRSGSRGTASADSPKYSIFILT